MVVGRLGWFMFMRQRAERTTIPAKTISIYAIKFVSCPFPHNTYTLKDPQTAMPRSDDSTADELPNAPPIDSPEEDDASSDETSVVIKDEPVHSSPPPERLDSKKDIKAIFDDDDDEDYGNLPDADMLETEAVAM